MSMTLFTADIEIAHRRADLIATARAANGGRGRRLRRRRGRRAAEARSGEDSRSGDGPRSDDGPSKDATSQPGPHAATGDREGVSVPA